MSCKKTKIYWAAPLHGKSERERNEQCVQVLRENGYQVYLPQEHGVWEEMVSENMSHFPNLSHEEVMQMVRHHLYCADKEAIEKCDCVIARGTHDDGSPSEGMIWEMGYAVGIHKPVYLLNPDAEAYHWDYNLMPEFGSTVFTTLLDIVTYLDQEKFK